MFILKKKYFFIIESIKDIELKNIKNFGKFSIIYRNKNPENITKEVIEIISSMFYGSKEFELFKNSIDENIKLN